MNKNQFDLKFFNKIYEENRLYNPNDEGYDNWMTKEDKLSEQPNLSPDKFDINIFNTVFEAVKIKQSQCQSVQKIDNPDAMIFKSDDIGYTPLGGRAIDNFGKTCQNHHSLTYSDLKEAYANTYLIDPTLGQYRNDFKNIEDLKKDRANIITELDTAEIQRRKMEIVNQKKLEERRANKLKSQLKSFDELGKEHYIKVHNILLGHNPNIEKWLSYD